MTTNESGYFQREVDGLHRFFDAKLSTVSAALNGLVTLERYNADQRITEFKFKEIQEDLAELKSAVEKYFKTLQDAITQEVSERRTAINDSETRRRTQDADNKNTKRQTWFFAIGILVPALVAVVLGVFK